MTLRTTAIALLTCLLLQTTPSHADEWESSVHAGSPRLLLYTLIKENPSGSENLVDQLLRNTGMTHNSDRAQLLSSTSYIQPLLSYDHNINGGIPSDTIVLGPFKFIIDEESRAKSGFLVGAQVGHARRYSLAFGRTATVGISGSYEHSLEHKIGKATGSAFGCHQSYLKDWTFLDLCLAANVIHRSSETDRIVTPSATLSKYFSSSIGSHEIKASLGGIIHQDYSKPYLSIVGTTVHSDFGTITASVHTSQPADGYNTRRWGAGLGIGKSVFGKYTEFRTDYSVEDGSSIFSTNRKDKILSISLERQINKTAKLHLSATSRRSTISAYDGEELNLRVELRPKRF